MPPKISVLIPAYNCETTIAATVNSVFAQDYKNFEIIVVDNGSTDSTPDILKTFGDKIICKKTINAGNASFPRNIGMELVQGDYIAFLDSDDIWFKHKLKKQVDFILKYPAIGFLCTNYFIRLVGKRYRMVRFFETEPALKKEYLDAPLPVNALELLLTTNFVLTSTVMVRKDVCQAVGKFDVTLKCCEDFEYWRRCAATTNFLILSDALVYKRICRNSLSADRIQAHLDQKRVLLMIAGDIKKRDKDTSVLIALKLRMVKNYYLLGNNYFSSRNIGKAFFAYLKGFLSFVSFWNLKLFISINLKNAILLLKKSGST